MLRSYRNGKISIYFSTKLNYRSTTTATMATATMATNECPRLQVAEPTTRRPLVSSVFRPTSEQVVVHTLSQWNPSYFKGTHTHTHARARARAHTLHTHAHAQTGRSRCSRDRRSSVDHAALRTHYRRANIDERDHKCVPP